MGALEPHLLIAALVDDAGGTLPAARAMGRPSFQGTLHKICAGNVKEPSRASAARISRHFGIPADAVYDGRLAEAIMRDRFPNHPALRSIPQSSGSPSHLGGVAHLSSLQLFDDPPALAWGAVMTSEKPLPRLFKLAVPDGALGELTPQGTMLVFDTEARPRPNWGVLVRDREGYTYVRRYAESTGGRWRAVAVDGYASLESDQHGLQLLAVATWRAGGVV